MGDGFLGTASTLAHAATLFVAFVVAIIAFVRFRATPSGLLIGGGLLVMALSGSCFAILSRVRSVDSVDAYMLQSAGHSCWTAILWIVVAAGVFLIPKSLATLAKGN
jgi:hypothetical protein